MTETPSDPELVDEYASRLLDGDIDRALIPARLVDEVNRRLDRFTAIRDELRLGTVDPSPVDVSTEAAVTNVLSHHATASMASVSPTANVVRLRRRRAVSVFAAAAALAGVLAVGVTLGDSSSDDSVNLADVPVAAAEATPEATMDSASDSGDATNSPAATEAPAAMAAAEAIPAATEDARGKAAGATSLPDVELENATALQSFLESEVATDGRLMSSATIRSEPLCPDPAGRPAIERGVSVQGRPAELHWSAADGAVVYLIDDCSAVLFVVP